MISYTPLIGILSIRLIGDIFVEQQDDVNDTMQIL